MASQIWVDVMTACGADGFCYTRNDGLASFRGNVSFAILDFHSGHRTFLDDFTRTVTIRGSSSQPLLRHCFGHGNAVQPHTLACEHSLVDRLASRGYEHCIQDGGTKVRCALEIYNTGDDGSVSSSNLMLLGTPAAHQLPVTQVQITSIVDYATDNRHDDGAVAVVHLHSEALALFVLLSTEAQGHFDTNAFTLLPNTSHIVKFITHDRLQDANATVAQLRRTVRVEHLRENLVQ
jgi:hypothetical protein